MRIPRRMFITSVLAVLSIALFLSNTAFTQDAPETLYVRCGKIIFDASKPAIGPASILIVNGKISAIGTSIPIPGNARQLDLSRYTVVPGFIDAHIHLWTGSSTQPSDGLAALRASKSMLYALTSGVVAVRVLGLAPSQGFTDVALAKAIEEGTIPGPHIVPAGHAITIPAGHGDWFTFPANMPLETVYSPLNGFINSPADAEKAVHLQIKYGARVIKIYASGGVGSPLDSFKAEQVSPEEMRTIVEQAHMAGIKVAAHAENLRTILDAIHAGVDSIEHGSDLNQEAVDYMKQHHIFLVPTVYTLDDALQHADTQHERPYEIEKSKELAKTHFASFQLAARSGVAIAAGSDKLYMPGGGTVLDEMIAEVKYGFTTQEALIAATKNGATLLDFNELGTLEVGKEADFVALDGDPLSDIHAVKKIKSVVFKGKIVLSSDGSVHVWQEQRSVP